MRTRSRGPNSRRGYTLIELMATFAIIAVLTIALGYITTTVLQDSKNRSAETNVQRVLLAEQGFAREHGRYSAYVSDIKAPDGVNLTNALSQTPDQVSIAVGQQGSLGLAVRRDGRTCVLVTARSLAAGGAVTYPGAAQAACTGSSALPSGEAEDLSARTTSISG